MSVRDDPVVSHAYGYLPLFDPAAGETILEPTGTSTGYWVGAPCITYDPAQRRYLLSYRVRVPRELGRGIETRIAASHDGRAFETIWSARKEAFGSASVERFALVRRPDGSGWLLFPSYVDGADDRWRIDVIEAERPEAFDVRTRRQVFTAADVGVEGVKDPVVVLVGRQYHMLISYATRPAGTFAREELHGTADIYNTGKTTSSTGLATSTDGRHWQWQGEVFAPRAGTDAWDAYAARVGCIVSTPPVFTAFYDGSASVAENYEERTGLAQSWDLRRYERLTPDDPALVSPHASGSLRYLDAITVGRAVWFYYEYARPDGSHELRCSVATLP
ncbi:MAG: hypothetical protein CL878_01655 [Dehalococcoidia bacterium]|nr:hypothetical protein [Dehalococcoidia bacterium]